MTEQVLNRLAAIGKRHPDAAISRYERLQHAAQAVNDVALEVDALYGRFFLLERLGRAGEIVDALYEASTKAESHHLPAQAARMAEAIGRVRYQFGEHRDAMHHWTRAVDMAELAHDWRTGIAARIGLGQIHDALGDTETGERFHRDAATLLKTVDDSYLASKVALNWGVNLYSNGLFDEAKARFQQGLSEAQRGHHAEYEAEAQWHLSRVAKSQENFDEARRLCEQALKQADACNYRWLKGVAYRTLTELAEQRGDIQGAIRVALQGLAYATQIQSRDQLVEYHLALARLYDAAGDTSASVTHLWAHQGLQAELNRLSAPDLLRDLAKYDLSRRPAEELLLDLSNRSWYVDDDASMSAAEADMTSSVVSIMHIDRLVLCMTAQQGEALQLKSWGEDLPWPASLSRKKQPKYLALVHEMHEPLVLHDARLHPTYDEMGPILESCHVRSRIEVPLFLHTGLAGVLWFEQHGTPRLWSRADVLHASHIGKLFERLLVGYGLAKAQRGRALVESATREVVLRLGMLSGQSYVETLSLQLREVLGADQVLIARRSSQGHGLQTLGVASDGALVPNFEVALEGSCLAEVMQGNELVVREGARRLHAHDSVVRQWLSEGVYAVPLYASAGDLLGVLAVYFRGPCEQVDLIGSLFGMFGGRISTEIERIAFEQQLQQANEVVSEKAQALLRNASDGIHVLNAQGQLIEASDSFGAMLGYRRDEVIGMHVSTWDANFSLDVLSNYLAAGQDASLSFESQHRRKDGRLIEVEISASVLVLAGQRMLFCSSRDITARRASERELKQYRLHLEELVADRTKDLRAARDDAERLASIKSDFLANMSHEIRTPMNAVLGFARIGSRDSAGTPLQATFDRIADAGQHLLRVINDVLDFSKIEARKFHVESLPFRLGATVNAAVEFIIEAAHSKGLELRATLDEQLPEWIMGDPSRLTQVLTNLLGNAVKFTDTGSVTLTVQRLTDALVFTVRDTGVGMTPEQLSRLFKPFEQGDASVTRRFGGTGLGLVISARLAELMGGSIEVKSEAGAGAEFTLRLPLIEAEPGDDAVPKKDTGPQQRLAGLRVLAADDVDVNLLIVEDALVQEGAIVTLAHDGRHALRRFVECGAQAFDIVLMDVQMPVMDGMEATRRLHQMAPNMPVVALTAHAMAEERDKCLAAGMVGHVTKPVNVDDLVAAIQRALALRPEAQAATPAPAQGAAPEAEPPTNAVSNHPVIDWEALDATYGHKPKLIERMLVAALAGCNPNADRLKVGAEKGDFEAIAFASHALRGVGSNLKAWPLHAAASAAEAAARSADPACIALAHQLDDRLTELMAELQQRVNPSEVKA